MVADVRSSFAEWELASVWAVFERAFQVKGVRPDVNVFISRREFFEIFGIGDLSALQEGRRVTTLPLYIFRLFDEANTGSACLYEIFMVLALYCTGDMRQKAAFCFRMFDIDAGGDIDQQELYKFLSVCAAALFHMKELPRMPSRRILQKIVADVMRVADRDGDGRIQWQEFYRWAQSSKHTRSLVENFRLAALKEDDPEILMRREAQERQEAHKDIVRVVESFTRRWSLAVMEGRKRDVLTMRTHPQHRLSEWVSEAPAHAPNVPEGQQASAGAGGGGGGGGESAPTYGQIQAYLHQLEEKAEEQEQKTQRAVGSGAPRSPPLGGSRRHSVDAPANMPEEDWEDHEGTAELRRMAKEARKRKSSRKGGGNGPRRPGFPTEADHEEEVALVMAEAASLLDDKKSKRAPLMDRRQTLALRQGRRGSTGLESRLAELRERVAQSMPEVDEFDPDAFAGSFYGSLDEEEVGEEEEDRRPTRTATTATTTSLTVQSTPIDRHQPPPEMPRSPTPPPAHSRSAPAAQRRRPPPPPRRLPSRPPKPAATPISRPGDPVAGEGGEGGEVGEDPLNSGVGLPSPKIPIARPSVASQDLRLRAIRNGSRLTSGASIEEEEEEEEEEAEEEDLMSPFSPLPAPIRAPLPANAANSKPNANQLRWSPLKAEAHAPPPTLSRMASFNRIYSAQSPLHDPASIDPHIRARANSRNIAPLRRARSFTGLGLPSIPGEGGEGEGGEGGGGEEEEAGFHPTRTTASMGGRVHPPPPVSITRARAESSVSVVEDEDSAAAVLRALPSHPNSPTLPPLLVRRSTRSNSPDSQGSHTPIQRGSLTAAANTGLSPHGLRSRFQSDGSGDGGSESPTSQHSREKAVRARGGSLAILSSLPPLSPGSPASPLGSRTGGRPMRPRAATHAVPGIGARTRSENRSPAPPAVGRVRFSSEVDSGPSHSPVMLSRAVTEGGARSPAPGLTRTASSPGLKGAGGVMRSSPLTRLAASPSVGALNLGPAPPPRSSPVRRDDSGSGASSPGSAASSPLVLSGRRSLMGPAGRSPLIRSSLDARGGGASPYRSRSATVDIAERRSPLPAGEGVRTSPVMHDGLQGSFATASPTSNGHR